ncbi:MAG: hypothetical protein ACYC3I_26455, partial [Gemmataceae bacterium]
MPRTKKGTPPSYRLHSSGQAVVTVRTTSGNRRDILLGPWDAAESRAEYALVLGVLAPISHQPSRMTGDGDQMANGTRLDGPWLSRDADSPATGGPFCP